MNEIDPAVRKSVFWIYDGAKLESDCAATETSSVSVSMYVARLVTISLCELIKIS